MPVNTKKNQARTTIRAGISGKAGVGKSYAIFRMAKNPLIFDLENKLPPKFNGVGDVVDFKGLPSYQAIKRELVNLLNDPKPANDFLVFDTASKLEELCETWAIQADYKNDKSKYSSYQVGPKHELPQYFAELLDLVDLIEERHKLNVLWVCHAKPKPQNNVLGKDYTKMVLDLREEVAAKLLKKLDYLGFVWDDVEVGMEGLHAKALKSERVISFDPTVPYFDAKSLKAMPMKIPFDEEGKWVETVFGKENKVTQ